MVEHKQDVLHMAQANEKPTLNTFIMSSHVQNVAHKLAKELWLKHTNKTRSARFQIEENVDQWFYYQEHNGLNLDEELKDTWTYTLGIESEWQREAILMHSQKANLFDAIFKTNNLQRRFQSAQFYNTLYNFFTLNHDYLIYPSNGTSQDVQLPCYTLLVFEEWPNGILATYISISQCKTKDIYLQLFKLNDNLSIVEKVGNSMQLSQTTHKLS